MKMSKMPTEICKGGYWIIKMEEELFMKTLKSWNLKRIPFLTMFGQGNLIYFFNGREKFCENLWSLQDEIFDS